MSAHAHPGGADADGAHGDTERLAPLSPTQRRLLFIERLHPATSLYHLHLGLELRGDLAVDALRRALEELVRRHDALRTTFAERDGTGYQVVAPPTAPVPVVDVVDLRSVPPHERAAALRACADEQARTPFDLQRGPLLRVGLVRQDDAYLLLATAHHLILDGWATTLLIRELAALYRAFRDGSAAPRPLPAVSYADACRRDLLRRPSAEHAAQLAYWTQRLAGLPPLALPADRPAPAARSPRGADVSFRLSRELTAALHALAKSEGATLFAVLLAGFAALLSRCGGGDDFGIGTAVANRARRQTRALVGFVANSVVLRCDLTGDPSVRTLLARARALVLEALQNQEAPFDEVVQAVGGSWAQRHAPLVQAQLVLERPPPVDRTGLPWSLRLETPNAAVPGSARFDLGLAFAEIDGRLWGTFSYSTDLFEPPTVERMADHLRVVLAGMAADPATRLSQLPLLTDAERHRLLVAWNPPVRAAAEPGFVPSFKAQVARSPDAAAVWCDDERLTYRELNARANQLARRLRALGVSAEARVAVCLERSARLLVGFIAVLKAGGAYVPLDPGYPQDWLDFMVADSGAAVVVTDSRLAARLPSHQTRTLCLDREGQALAELDASDLAPDARAGQLAYVIYTSGSTGRPKGAMLEHRGMANHLRAKVEDLRLGPSDVVAQTASQCFDVSVWQMLAALLVGGRVDVLSDDVAHRPARLLDAVAAHGVTVLELVPSMLREVAAEATARPRPLPTLRWLLPTGEALASVMCRDWLRLYPTVPLVNAYGPTECSDDVTHHVIPDAPAGAWAPIGRPLRNLRAYVLGPGLALLPVGVPGELYIGGVGVGRGYAGRPGLTAERFVPDPFADPPGQRLYRTGDRARWRADGVLEFLGRVDFQVKLRGFRVELGEVEAAVAACPGVRACAVAAHADARGERRLVAYVVFARPDAPQPDLAAALAQRLPGYMVPSVVVALETLPLGPNGKVDRNALPAPALGADGGRTPPKTALECALVGLFQRVLQTDGLGVDDDFFALGGTSLLAATLVARVEEQLGELVHLTAPLDAPTAARLADYLTQRYPAAVARRWNVAPAPPHDDPDDATTARVSPELVRELRRVVDAAGSRQRSRAPARPRNPRAVFILSPPRSGSTLLRVMLAGHPRLFAPPELELLGFESMGERERALSGRYAFQREGAVRALMEAKGLGVDAAKAEIAGYEIEDLPTAAFYATLQAALGARTLVDKTSAYALELAALERAEAWFDAPLYLHLVRHPYAMVRSFEEARLEEVFFRHPHGLRPRALAEAVFVLSHENILRFLAGVPAARQRVVRFESLVADPVAVLTDICTFAGLEYQPAMAAPYAEQHRKMTDGLHAASRMLGDVKFHQHKDVDPGVATRWTEHHTDDFLSDQAAALATSLGYPIRRDGPDWTAELRLDPTILPAHTTAAPGGGSGRHVLLTGATGFVGAYLARELLETDNVARLHCLVRARDERDGLAAVRANLARYGLWKDDYAARIAAVAGELGAERLGLGAADFARLGARLDAVFHAGARVSFVDTYARMKGANVGGTLELLRLAATGGRTAFHHVSTVSVLDRLTYADESHAAGHPAWLPHGYAQSKAVAERLVEQAGARGVPVTVYRLGMISGDAQTGAWNTDAFACRMLAGSVALGIFPEELADVPITWMPVDHAARALVCLSQRPGTTERFHLVNPATVPVGTVLGWVSDLGHPVALRPYAAWRAAMRDACARGAAPALEGLAPFFPETVAALDTGGRARARATAAVLADTPCPAVDAALIGRYVAYLRAAGMLPATRT